MDNSEKEALQKGLQALGLSPLTYKQMDQFDFYHQLLLSWNKKINLISRKDQENIVIKHFLDSLSVLKAVDLQEELRCIDVGAGAGLPSIPLLIYNPMLNFTLVESIRKKVSFLKEAISNLKFEHLEIVEDRAEVINNDEKYRETFDLVFARALAKLPRLIEICFPFLKVKGKIVAQKGADPKDEINQSQKILSLLGGEIKEVLCFTLPFTVLKRSIIIIEKIKFP